MLACGTLSKEAQDGSHRAFQPSCRGALFLHHCAQEAKAPDRFKPWWILLEDDGDLILSIRGSATLAGLSTRF